MQPSYNISSSDICFPEESARTGNRYQLTHFVCKGSIQGRRDFFQELQLFMQRKNKNHLAMKIIDNDNFSGSLFYFTTNSTILFDLRHRSSSPYSDTSILSHRTERHLCQSVKRLYISQFPIAVMQKLCFFIFGEDKQLLLLGSGINFVASIGFS